MYCMNNKQETVKVCRCGHLPVGHKGFSWFHMTQCKELECDCEKYETGKIINHDLDGEYGDILLRSNSSIW